MSCPGRELMLDPNHVASCRECQARATLISFAPPSPSPTQRVRMWGRIDEAADRPLLELLFASLPAWLTPPRLAGAFAAIALIGILSYRTGTTETAFPRETWVQIETGENIPVAGANIRVEAPGKLWMEPAELGRELRVFRGVLVIDEPIAAAPAPLAIETPRARIVTLGAKYRLSVDAQGTHLTVERGEIEVTPTGEDKRIVRAGERFDALEPAAANTERANAERANIDGANIDGANTIGANAAGASAETDSAPANTEAEIARARSLIGKDDQRAGEIADRVLAQKPRAEEEVEALIIAADARRRSGRLLEAEQHYARVIAHPSGHLFAEEAYSRRATILADLDRTHEALQLLAEARSRFAAGGALIPERIALEARLLHKRGQTLAAAELLENAGTDRVLDPVRLEVGRALLPTDRERARRVLGSLFETAIEQ